MTVKDRQRQHWDAVASGWAKRLAWTERNFLPLTDWFARAAGWTSGHRMIDVACGPGYPTFAAAAAVGPDGSVLGLDISGAMVSAASGFARSSGVTNVEFREMDAEALQLQDGSFDSAVNAYGLMFCPEPERAVRELWRVLKPGGHCAMAVWDERIKSPFFDVMLSVASPLLALPSPDPRAPGPFRLASADTLESMTVASGFSDVRVERLTLTFECESVADYCQLFADVALKARMDTLSDSERARLETEVEEASRSYVQGGHLQLPAVSLCVSGRKP